MKINPLAHTFPAPAKLNLDLRITGRRADGYHCLETIFCLVDLCDRVYLSVREDGLIVLHSATEGVPAQQDLSYRAAIDLKHASSTSLGANISLEKKIPMGGGLGGGSSDAATVLLALNQLWNTGLSRRQLMQIGLRLGADVPFFIFGRNAFATGIGEELVECAIPKQWYVIVKPPVHVSTALIFSHKRLTRDSEPSIMPTFLSLQPFRNDMQAVVFEEYPEVYSAYQNLKQFGQPLMTGSGACIFVAFAQYDEAKRAYLEIAASHQAFLVEGLDKHPMLEV